MREERLKKLNDLFEALSVIADGSYVYLCDMKEDYSRWSKSAVDFFNLPDIYMEHAGEIWEEHVHPEDKKIYHQSIENIFSGADSGHDMQYRAMAKDGTYAVCTCKGIVIHDADGNPEYFGGAIKNHGLMSYIDAVTGLRSLYGFFDDLESIFYKREENSVLLVGLNGFSNINDIYGYTFGNRVLQKFGMLLKEKYANKGALYRMDGTKFAVISRELTPEQLAGIYSLLKKEVSHDFYVNQEHVSISLNAGIVRIDTFDISKETVYSCLKYAYYESKSRRLGEAVIFADALSDEN
ncbi:MAG: diguanylate cyclase, partial [Oscillospiraceae bacterium]|nr:diguanylate cyclase [Oscillospiraceae bacterium]